MAEPNGSTQPMDHDPAPKRCFAVSAFGSTPEEQRRTKQVLRHLVRKVLVPRGYVVVRADEIDDEGLITNQIIEHLLEDELVVADLSGRNPNVFYELAVRHAARKPVIHLITAGEPIPFDIANMRAVPYALDDPDLLEQAQNELSRKVDAIESSDEPAANPISAARNVWLLRESDKPELQNLGEVLGAISSLRDEVRSLARRVPPDPYAKIRPAGDFLVDDDISMLSILADKPLPLQEFAARSKVPAVRFKKWLDMGIVEPTPLGYAITESGRVLAGLD